VKNRPHLPPSAEPEEREFDNPIYSGDVEIADPSEVEVVDSIMYDVVRDNPVLESNVGIYVEES